MLVHGIGVSSKYFMPLAQQLSQKHRVICIDLPGFGYSKSQGISSIGQHAHTVGKVIDALGLKNPVLIGHSMGTQVVMALNASRPTKFKELILIGPTVDPNKRSPLSHFYRLSSDSLREPPRLNKIVVGDYFRCGIRRYLKTLQYMLSDYIEDYLESSSARILIIRGSKDPIVQRAWATVAASLPKHGSYVEIPEAPHIAHYTHPKQVAHACLVLVKK